MSSHMKTEIGPRRANEIWCNGLIVGVLNFWVYRLIFGLLELLYLFWCEVEVSKQHTEDYFKLSHGKFLPDTVSSTRWKGYKAEWVTFFLGQKSLWFVLFGLFEMFRIHVYEVSDVEEWNAWLNVVLLVFDVEKLPTWVGSKPLMNWWSNTQGLFYTGFEVSHFPQLVHSRPRSVIYRKKYRT